MLRQIRYFLVTVFITLFLPFDDFAQQCTGSLGDPVTKINFGAGASNPGSALATGITNYPFGYIRHCQMEPTEQI